MREVKIGDYLIAVIIGDVSFVMLRDDWKKVKQRLLNKEIFAFYSLSNKKMEIIEDKVSGQFYIVDTYLRKTAQLNI